MLARAFLLLFLASFVPAAALSQVEPSATGGCRSQDDTDMTTPPPVSGMPYANCGADASIKLSGLAHQRECGVYTTTYCRAHSAAGRRRELLDLSLRIALNKSTAATKDHVAYSPGFSLLSADEPALDTVDQSASLGFQDRLSPHLSISVQDYFLRTSDVFNESYPFSSREFNRFNAGAGSGPDRSICGADERYSERFNRLPNRKRQHDWRRRLVLDFQFSQSNCCGRDFPIRTAKVVRHSIAGDFGQAVRRPVIQLLPRRGHRCTRIRPLIRKCIACFPFIRSISIPSFRYPFQSEYSTSAFPS